MNGFEQIPALSSAFVNMLLVWSVLRFVLRLIGFSCNDGLAGISSRPILANVCSGDNFSANCWELARRDVWHGTEIWEREEYACDLPREYGDERY